MFSNWKKQNPPEKKKSFLWKFKDEILSMRREEYTFKQIRDALISEYKIATTVQNISYFCKKLQKENYQKESKNEWNRGILINYREEEKYKNKIAELIFRLLDGLEKVRDSSEGQIREQIREQLFNELELIL